MRDLNEINRLNYEAFAASINHHRLRGRHVLACYEGSTLVSIEIFSSHEPANQAFTDALSKTTPASGTRFVMFYPLGLEEMQAPPAD
jgi:hypothetical protein